MIVRVIFLGTIAAFVIAAVWLTAATIQSSYHYLLPPHPAVARASNCSWTLGTQAVRGSGWGQSGGCSWNTIVRPRTLAKLISAIDADAQYRIRQTAVPVRSRSCPVRYMLSVRFWPYFHLGYPNGQPATFYVSACGLVLVAHQSTPQRYRIGSMGLAPVILPFSRANAAWLTSYTVLLDTSGLSLQIRQLVAGLPAIH